MAFPEISCPLCKKGTKVSQCSPRQNDTEGPTQNIVDRALLAEASQSVQYTLHALPQGTVLQKGSAQKHSSRSGLPKPAQEMEFMELILPLLHSLGLLQAIEPERDAPCGLCPETKAAQVLSLQGWHRLE